MTDPQAVFPDVAKRWEFVADNWGEANQWIALRVHGHPRAQDFEPTGHGGSDPTGQSGLLGDQAAQLGKELRRRLKRVFEDVCYLEARVAENLHAERPKFNPEDPDEYCRNHLQLDEYVYRYRGDKCRPCYERTLWLRDNRFGDEISSDDLRYHRSHGRWPRKTGTSQPAPMRQPLPDKPNVDVVRIAGTERLALQVTAMDAAQAAAILLEGTA